MTAGMKAFQKAAEVPRKLRAMDGLSSLSANIDFADVVSQRLFHFVHSSCMDYSVDLPLEGLRPAGIRVTDDLRLRS